VGADGFVLVAGAVVVVGRVATVVAGAETVTLIVRVAPEVECPITQPTKPAGTSSAKKRSQRKISPTVIAGLRCDRGDTLARLPTTHRAHTTRR
jgi:hypothetical protein